jgi:hypothetical protein
VESKPLFSDQDLNEAVDVDWTGEQEHWNTYKLADGSTLKVKLVLKGVKRLLKCSPDGTPIYMIVSDNVVRVTDVPKELKAKPRQPTMKPI